VHEQEPPAPPTAADEALAQVQRELNACRQQSRFGDAALRAISDAVVIVDLDGNVSLLNPVAAHLTGWTEQESIGRPLGDVVRFVDEAGNGIDPLSPDSTWHFTSLRRRDGHVVLVDGTVATIVDDLRHALGSVITFRNVTAAKRLTDELQHQAHHDPLTGLPNRRAFESRLRRAVQSAKEMESRHALLYFDLDNFKPVNDTAGHAAGDELLRQLAKLLRSQLREGDALARLGGDEFAVLLEDVTPEQATFVAEKVRRAIAAHQFDWQGDIFRIGASIGQLEFSDGKLTAYELLYRADEMCYLAKSRGRDRVVAFSRERDRSGDLPKSVKALRSNRSRLRRPGGAPARPS
jgi:diguanylate cyclase (GGDEF)-like protein/PAS domain S-box-containing protein